MLLMHTVQDDTMAVSGFQHQTFMCSSCHDVERRLVFAKQDERTGAKGQTTKAAETTAAIETAAPVETGVTGQTGADPVSEDAAPSISPLAALPSVAADQVERTGAAGVLRRVFARLRGG